MQMRVYKQFYMIFVLIRACLWNVSSSFAGNGEEKLSIERLSKKNELSAYFTTAMASAAIYVTGSDNEVEQYDFLRTQTSRVAVLPVFHRDNIYIRKNLRGERARFLRLLLFPNHSFG